LERSADQRVLIEMLSNFLFLIAPAIVVAVGAYLHARHRKTSGLIMIACGSLLLTIMGVLLSLVGTIYTHPIWYVVLMLAPSAMALLTFLAVSLIRLQAIVQQSS